MKEEVWKENKQRYDELNPRESLGAKFWWSLAAICLAVVVLYFAAF